MTDVKLTPHSNRLLTGSFMRILRLYDTQNFDVVGSQHLEHAPMSLDVFYSDRCGAQPVKCRLSDWLSMAEAPWHPSGVA